MLKSPNNVSVDYTSTIEEVYLQSLLLMQEESPTYPVSDPPMGAVVPRDRIIALAEAMAINLQSVRGSLTIVPTARAQQLPDCTLRVGLDETYPRNRWYLQYNQFFKPQSV